MELAGRVAMVSGGGSGIGREICLQLAEQGACISILDINGPAAEAVASEIQNADGKSLAICCDITDPLQVLEAVNQTVSEFGDLHILVNNAGICPLRSFESISLDEWNQVLSVNLTGAFLLCQAAISHLRIANKKGRIINIGSLAGQTGGISVGAHYSVSKAGLMVLTKCLAKLLAPDHVTVNSISPGTTDTALTQSWDEETREALRAQIPLGRLGLPQDVASLAVFLASDHASYITGATINVNGGLYFGT